jgi:hypothetical protein
MEAAREGSSTAMPATVLVVEDERKLRRRIETDPGVPRVVHTGARGGYRRGLTRDD